MAVKKNLSCQVESPYAFLEEESIKLDSYVFDAMWKLFYHIVDFWKLDIHLESAKSQLLAFMENRIKIDLNYYADYKIAASVLRELSESFGEKKAYIKLLTDPSALIEPPTTKIARARQRVSNEFIILAISIGGFSSFGAKNAIGHIGNANIENKPPYRVYKDEEKK